MDQNNLTREKLEQVASALQPALEYLSRLKARINANSFPIDGSLRRHVGSAQGSLESLFRHLEHLKSGGTGDSVQKPGPVSRRPK